MAANVRFVNCLGSIQHDLGRPRVWVAASNAFSTDSAAEYFHVRGFSRREPLVVKPSGPSRHETGRLEVDGRRGQWVRNSLVGTDRDSPDLPLRGVA